MPKLIMSKLANAISGLVWAVGERMDFIVIQTNDAQNSTEIKFIYENLSSTKLQNLTYFKKPVVYSQCNNHARMGMSAGASRT